MSNTTKPDTAMTVDEFEQCVAQTAIYPRVRLLVGDSNHVEDAVDAPWLYPILGLIGESGELANQAKKIIRDDGGILTNERAEKMRDELGDCQWYAPRVARGLGAPFSTVLKRVLEKLRDRAMRGVLRGSGDNR